MMLTESYSLLRGGVAKVMAVLTVLMAIQAGVQAQTVPAPLFVCVDNDTLKWAPQPSTCGPFVGYDIYWSASSVGGPYTLLTQVTNVAQLTYYHPNPTGETRYYYIKNNYSCPGANFLSSDTLDNLLPELPNLNSASVSNGNEVTLSWDVSPSPEVIGYIIYRTTLIGLTPIDTVFNQTTYTDPTASADSQSEAYSVIALDGCGNTSIFGVEHQTILLTSSQDSCNRSISLSWTPYVGWDNITKQEIWYTVGNVGPNLLATLSATETSYLLPEVIDQKTYCFYIRAYGDTPSEMAVSNESCLTTSLAIPIRQMSLINADIKNNSVILSWVWNTDADVKYVHAWRQKYGEEFMMLDNYVASVPLNDTGRYVINGSNFTRGSLTFYVEGANVCDSIIVSNKAEAMILLGRPTIGNVNILDWSNYFNEIGVVNSYDVMKELDGIFVTLTEVAGTDSTYYYDQVDFDEFEACYMIVANATVTLPDGSTRDVRTRSNRFCISQIINIVTPNAFAPQGDNDRFKPVLTYRPLLATYNMKIFDRFGKQLYESDDPDRGWDGTYNGEDMPFGTYVYTISITQTDGRENRSDGMFILLR